MRWLKLTPYAAGRASNTGSVEGSACIAMLEAAAFDNEPIDRSEAQRLVEQAEDLLASVL
jgi:hypothetical protein